jgi:hypothetical protein
LFGSILCRSVDECGFFECSVGIGGKDTIFKNEVLTVAEWLGTGYAATDKVEIAGVPSEVLAFDVRVIDRAVFTFPESVFGVQHGVVNLNAFGVLENLFACQTHITDTKRGGMHKRIGSALYFNVGQLSVAAVPECLCAVSNLDAFHD